MGEVRFMISEAAKQVHVESHVLRYWEEELDLKIGRTEMGHRYYTEDDIQLFRCIRKLKNEGMLLRDLKPLIPELKATRKKLVAAKPARASVQRTSEAAEGQNAEIQSPEDIADSQNTEKQNTDTTGRQNAEKQNTVTAEPSAAAGPSSRTTAEVSTGLSVTEAEVIPVTQLEQARELIGDVLNEVVSSNNEVLEKNISRKVTADVIREMDFLFQAKERQEEEHFRKLDCLIRQQQANRREVSKDTPLRKLKKILT